MADAHTIERTAPDPAACFTLLALVLLGTRFVQGFIFWGGASRRLLYNFREVNGADVAVKLDFDSVGFVANKLTHALPGTLWIQGPLEWTLQSPDLIVASVWLWDGATLSALPDTAISNVYPYVWASHFKTGTVGFSGQTGARATITLPPPRVPIADAAHALVLEAINGATWQGQLADTP